MHACNSPYIFFCLYYKLISLIFPGLNLVGMSSSHLHRKKSSIGVDRISDLPNSVLCHILSSLETKLSIQTCVLSKRWKSLWSDVPCLYFHRLPPPTKKPKKKGAFEKLVTTSLLLHKCQSLNKFRLVCLEEADRFNNVPAWLSTAIARDVRVLDLNLVSSNDGMSRLITLPSSIFTCKSLEILKLEGDLLVRASSLVSLPRLESLNLKGVKFGCDESVRKRIGGCPVLESLYIERNRCDNVLVFTVSSKSLRHLEIIATGFASVQENIDLKLEINAPCLKYLRLCDCVSNDFSFQSLTVLNELHLFDLDNLEPVYYFYWVFDLVETVSEELKILAIGDEGFLEAVTDSWKKFSNLTNLILTSSSWNWTTLLFLLDRAENLEVLVLKAFCREFHEVAFVPVSLSSSIRRISILSRVRDGRGEVVLGMMKYFLEHGEFLRQIQISNCQVYTLLEELLLLSRKSSACQVLVVH